MNKASIIGVMLIKANRNRSEFFAAAQRDGLKMNYKFVMKII